MPRLKDKVVLVTGAAGAIGAAIAQAIEAEGGTAISSDLAGRGNVATHSMSPSETTGSA